MLTFTFLIDSLVSTHSRLKAAGAMHNFGYGYYTCFNTQPPEGGWPTARTTRTKARRFNTQPPEGGWPLGAHSLYADRVSTHSRLKAAGPKYGRPTRCRRGFNTQPPEGGWVGLMPCVAIVNIVSTHSRLKAAGANAPVCGQCVVCFNTQPPEGGWRRKFGASLTYFCFNTQPPEGGWSDGLLAGERFACFNTQPPEGGWV